jgi:hypothetical protein
VIVSGPTRIWPCSMNLTACTEPQRLAIGSTRGGTHRADGLRHARGARDDGEPAAAERRDGELALDVAELRLRVEHAGVVELGEQRALGAGAVRVRRGEQRKPVRVLPELPAQLVISTTL